MRGLPGGADRCASLAYHDLASRLTLRDRRSASAARIPADLHGAAAAARQEAMNSLDLAPYPARLRLAGKCRVTVLEISDHVCENSQDGPAPGQQP